ncbi:hypothetical protein DNTS_018854 [Danionella cerebrum]|uniref:Uncharacterized protein n=1 Tax=Danionella cerebrum TaxID=2873325 RepID=A0A553MS13_9TELE|nr:hypothetical protein DNTS_018854 [Danionella translucida]
MTSHRRATLQKLAQKSLGSVRAELHLYCPRAEEGCGPPCGSLTQIIVLYTPGFSKLIHIELKVSISTKRVVPPLTIVVSTQATEMAFQMGCCHHLYQTVAVPCDLQT